MRNLAKRAADGPPPDDRPNAADSSVARRSRRREKVVIGTVGLLSIFGASVLATQQVLDARDSVPSAANGSEGAPPVSPGPSGNAKNGTAVLPAPSSAAPRSRTSPERIAAARSAAANATSRVRRPLPQQFGAAAEVGDVTTTTRKQNGETLKVVSARRDLTGYRELGWAADQGQKVGSADCTQNIRLSADVPVRHLPTLLLCWHTSATKSVYTVAVKIGGQPSTRASVAEIDKVWSSLS
jgi:hypothetical protein